MKTSYGIQNLAVNAPLSDFFSLPVSFPDFTLKSRYKPLQAK
jgi:hypothetical protein